MKHKSESEKFDDVMERLLAVPYTELQKKLEEEKRNKKAKKKRRATSSSGHASSKAVSD